MKPTIILLAMAATLGAQTRTPTSKAADPKPVIVIEPVTQPVLHCPAGWHVEVWHRAAPTYGGLYGFVTPPDKDEYRAYQKPVVITAGDEASDAEHPAKCVRDPNVPPSDYLLKLPTPCDGWTCNPPKVCGPENNEPCGNVGVNPEPPQSVKPKVCPPGKVCHGGGGRIDCSYGHPCVCTEQASGIEVSCGLDQNEKEMAKFEAEDEKTHPAKPEASKPKLPCPPGTCYFPPPDSIYSECKSSVIESEKDVVITTVCVKGK